MPHITHFLQIHCSAFSDRRSAPAHGLVAGADGRFHILWADSRGGVYQLRTATVRVRGKAERAQ
jgi:hypothetical protein